MKQNPEPGRKFGQLKHFAYAFVLAVAGYFVLFHLIERARVSEDPWTVTFSSTGQREPKILLRQNAASPEERAIIFVGRTVAENHSAQTLVFKEARPVPFEVPFGRCIFQDTTFMPGTIVLEVFGHTIEMMPKALLIDGKAHEWSSGFTEIRVTQDQGTQ